MKSYGKVLHWGINSGPLPRRGCVVQMKNIIISSYKKIDARSPSIAAYLRDLFTAICGRNHSKIIGKNNKIKRHGSILRSVQFEIFGNDNSILIGDKCIAKDLKIHIRGNNNLIEIHDDSRFNGASDIWIEDNRCHLSIGQKCTFEGVHLALTEDDSKIEIGEDCMFAYNIEVRTGDSHSVIDNKSNKRINEAKNVKIENHVWIASHTLILKGSTIGSHSVVAAGSIVTKSFQEVGSILAGNPAKIVRQGVTWTRDRLKNNLN